MKRRRTFVLISSVLIGVSLISGFVTQGLLTQRTLLPFLGIPIVMALFAFILGFRYLVVTSLAFVITFASVHCLISSQLHPSLGLGAAITGFLNAAPNII